MEKKWEYKCWIRFYGFRITNLTITDHYQTHHPEIRRELIVKLIERLNEKEIEPTDYLGSRKVFRFETYYQQKKYRLIFWFKDNTPNHLWIRNCYRVD